MTGLDHTSTIEAVGSAIPCLHQRKYHRCGRRRGGFETIGLARNARKVPPRDGNTLLCLGLTVGSLLLEHRETSDVSGPQRDPTGSAVSLVMTDGFSPSSRQLVVVVALR